MKEIILKVDKNDNVVGEVPKDAAHDDKGILHRAFLAIVFNKEGKILLAKRSKLKRLWPGFWDGSIASHQRNSETMAEAVKRRLKEELGIKKSEVKSLFKFCYQTSFGKVGSEKEICHVFEARTKEKIKPNKREVVDLKWLNFKKLKEDIKNNPRKYTPWFLIVYKQFLNDTI